MVGRSVRPCDDLKYRVSVTRLGECQTVARGYSSNKNHGLCPLHVPSSLQLFHVQWYLILLVKHSLGRVTRSPERDSRMRASLHGLGTLFFLSAVSFSTRRSQSVKLGYVCSLCHARSESLGNRTLFSLPFFSPPFSFPPVLLFFSSFLYFFLSFFLFFSLHPLPPAPLPTTSLAIRSPQGKLVFSIARRRAGTKTRGGYRQPSRSNLFFQTGTSIILEGDASAPFNRERRAICRSFLRIKLFPLFRRIVHALRRASSRLPSN